MNDPRLDALERLTKRQSELALGQALMLRNNGFITDEQYEELKRQRERMEANT